MTKNDEVNKKEAEQMSAAWARLEKQLQASEQSPLWEQWEEQGKYDAHPNKETSASASVVHTPVTAEQSIPAQMQANVVPVGRVRTSPGPAVSHKPNKSGAAGSWFKRNMGKTIAACAAALITVVIATPSTNEALAAWLNTFRMDNVMIVQQNDLESLMNSFMKDGETLETVNRFGSFEQTTEGNWSELTMDQASKELGFPVPTLTVPGMQSSNISSMSAQSFTFRLNVDEINNAMRKLGADKLLPKSVDGKAIEFNTGKGVTVTYEPLEGSTSKQSVWVEYVKQPSIKIDPSVDAKDAYEAVIRFPALPDHLRKSLVQASSMENGEIPFPLITNEKPEKIVIEGVEVYLNQSADLNNANAMWLEDGMVTNVHFNNFEDKQKVQSLIAELIHS
ncbi:hypothetical protein [Bacillus sp. FJAT-28004]|uniref:hypothetical protein n=1 Tax=Bacillus sp. FJAT-28004 TaxID=1679165 RepID=UPI0006B4A437|nr:hypothetical protein [Bacillus sp. FJAT-28004]